ncbi:AEC family transporter [uncultured Cohaesibacter sp.]|uniref:AEC family transporter n=1 Tax=uncultured Cohaesibacter sp. TaxID=1002546 RepID=UPI0029C608B2|nr:AEC family transporter [uncultured Cohaesibacter sp.]
MTLLEQILPILLIILVGVALRRFDVFSPSAIEAVTRIVVTIVLPSVLFTAFLDMEMKVAYAGVFVIVGSVCFGLYALGILIGRLVAPHHPYFRFLFTGLEYGMLGVSLFGGAYGLEQVGYIAVVDLAHELFIWFLFAPLLMIKRDGKGDAATVLKMFATSPVVIALVAGLALNGLGLADFVKTAPVLSSIHAVLKLFAGMAIPLILLVVGYGIRIRREGLGDVLVMVALRYGIVVPTALILNHFVLDQWLQLEQPFQIAFFTLMILPPPFIIPLFMQNAEESERIYVTNALAVSTVISLTIFAIYLGMHPTL